MNKLQEQQLADNAIEAFNRTGAGVMRFQRGGPAHGFAADFQIEIETDHEKRRYLGEVKRTLFRNTRMQLLMLKDRVPRLLIITKYVNPILAEQMKQDGIQFIDTAGNAFLKDRNLFIFIKGNKPPGITKEDLPPRTFRPAGLKLLFALLREPTLLAKTYREIAIAANVALGTVAWVMDDLKKMGFLVRNDERRFQFKNCQELMNQWATAYGELLRPKLKLGKYTGNYGWWEKAKMDPEKEQWGGEIAAAKLTDHLKPQFATIYMTKQNMNDFLLKNRLKKDPAGNTEILEKFWPDAIEQKAEETVHPIVAYADLLTTGDPRNIEAAKMLYEREIDRFIGKD